MATNPKNSSSFPRWNGSQRRIGLTGGIASGKSSFGGFLAELKGLPVLDADRYSHEIMAPGTQTTKKILKHFGKAIEASQEEKTYAINRKLLGKIIFGNSTGYL